MNLLMHKSLTFIFTTVLSSVVLSVPAFPENGRICENEISARKLETFANSLCEKPFGKMERAMNLMNLGGGLGDEELEKFARLLNTLSLDPETYMTDQATVAEIVDTLAYRSDFRDGIRKNIVFSLFDETDVHIWCGWYKDNRRYEEPLRAPTESVRRLDLTIRCAATGE